MDSSSSLLDKQILLSDRDSSSPQHVEASPTASADKNSSSTFSEDQYNDASVVHEIERAHSTTPRIRAMSDVRLAMSSILDNNGGPNSNRFPSCDLVRAAIHHLGDLFCDFNESLSANSVLRKNSSNLSYKEHENESMDATTFIAFIEDKFHIYGYTVQEINQLFITLRPQTPLHISSRNTHKQHRSLTIHFTEFNVVIHQMYTAKFKSILSEKTSYQQHHIHRLLLDSISHQLQTVRKALEASRNGNGGVLRSPISNASGPEVPPPINMNDLLAKHKMQQERLRQKIRDDAMDEREDDDAILHSSPMDASSPIFGGMTMSPVGIKVVGARPIGISNREMMDMVDTPVSNFHSEEETLLREEDEEDLESYDDLDDTDEDEDDDDDDDDDLEDTDDDDLGLTYGIDDIMQEIEHEIEAHIQVGTHIQFSESGVVIQCANINREHHFYEFHTPQTLLQDSDPFTLSHLYRLQSARSDDTDLSSMFAPSTTGAASPLSILSSSAMLVSKDNPFKIASEPNDSVYRRQEYMYQLSQFFGANVYLTTQQLRFVDIDPKLPDFMSNEEPSLHMLHRPISASNQSNDTRHRSGNIRDVAQINTEQPTKKGGKAAKVNENKDLYDEDKKLAGLLQSRSSLHYDYVPNGLLTHRQFIEFIDSLYISNYDENVLKHMFRYIYTEELPPILPPPVVIEFDQGQEDNYNNVNGMYVAYSECIGYEYDEVMDLIADNADKQSFDDLVTTMVMERLQNIYQTLKFDDLDAHPNQFLHREQSFHRQQETDKLDGDELKENVYNYFTEQNIKNNITHRQSLTQNTQVSTMRSTASDTVTFNGMFRRSIISHESLGNMLESMKKDKQDKTPKLVHQVSSSTTTLTLHPPRTPVSPGTTPSHLDTFDKYPALIDITDIPHQYHHRIHSLQSKLMKKASLNALIDDDQTYKSSTTDLHKPPTHNGVSRSTAASPSIGNITVLTNVANMDNFTPKEGSDDDHDLITQLNEMKDNNDNNLPPVFVNSSSNDSNEIVSPNGTKRKKVHRQHSASRQPSLPTLPEEHIDANHNSNSAAHGQPSVDARAKKRLKNIDGRVDQLFATIGSDQVHIHLLKYGLRLIEVSLHGDEHYFLQILQTYANHKYNSHSPQRFFVHKDWIKQFLYDDNIPHRLKSLQRKIINNLRRKSHLLVSELSRRSSYGTTSTYPSNASSEDTFTNRATHNSTEPMLHALPREVQQTYVAYFKQTLKSRAKALTQYTQTRYPPTHKKHWRDVFLFMSDGENYLDRVTFKEGIERCGIKIRTQKKSGKQKRNKIEIQQILNAVFVEMDFDNTGYVTIHAFTNMMMAVDPPIASTQSSTAYHSNRNSHNVYDVYSNYGISDSATNPRKSYEMQQRVAGAPQYNYNATHGQYLSPQHATQQHMPRPYSHGQHLSPFDAKYHNNNNYHTQPQQRQSKKRRKKKKKSRHHHHSSNKGHDHTYDLSDLSSQEEREPPHIQQYYPEDEDDIVEEKTMATHEDDAYLNRTWNGDVMDEYNPHVHHSHHKKYSHHREEEQDEKIPMLDVLNQHERQMKGANQSKDTQQLELEEVQQKKKGKKKMKKKKKGTNEPNYSFIVSRRKLSALDLIIRRYYMTIDASKGCVVLSPLSDCISEVSMEFGLHQIIVGDHQSTMIRVKTLNGKDIYYEFDVRQAKDEFVDLLDDVKQKSGSNNFNSPHILPRGIGFGADHSIGDIQHQLQLNVHVHSMFDDDDIDVDPIYDDECAVCRTTLCNCSTLYWFVLLSCAHLLMIYLYTNGECID